MSTYLSVAVHCDPARGHVEIQIPRITLTAAIPHVVWWCDNLPAGGSLHIKFSGDGAGPFQDLEPSGHFVIGSGNVGKKRHNEYRYEARVQAPGVDCTGAGAVLNSAHKPAAVPELVCDPTEGPPRCHEVPTI
jgi:hypothetical protein